MINWRLEEYSKNPNCFQKIHNCINCRKKLCRNRELNILCENWEKITKGKIY